MINADACYRLAEQKAADYFKSLSDAACAKELCPYLNKRYTILETEPYSSFSLLSLFSRGKRKSGSKGYHNYIQWLDYTGKLDNYLDRSISYIFMRDLGKALNSPDTQTRVRHVS